MTDRNPATSRDGRNPAAQSAGGDRNPAAQSAGGDRNPAAQSAGGDRKGLPRHSKILFGLLFGIVLGLVANSVGGGAPWVDWSVRNVAYPLGQLFLRLIFM